ncbi:NADPH-dependent FMN reductase [Pontibacter kalidii]|uniref:NADPH-dependent FMN reductase n=1 Tax=Pontibacter kalidii TaxID=2592049 RepID=UPI002253FB1A|nr:NAD(P)H-dependent oxidoreductase [Pontibacter kalidii]
MSTTDRLKIAVIIGSTRPGRNGEAVGKWVYEIASKRSDATFELIDLLEVNLPFLDEPNSPAMQKYTKQHTKDWSARIDPFDAFVLVTPEYNHGVPASLKNALDFLYKEWNNKAVGFVAYGNAGGARSVEHLRNIVAELQMADVREQVALSLFTDFENYTDFKPASFQEKKLNTLLDQLISWGTALKQVRTQKKEA